jgi:hypothetical protein
MSLISDRWAESRKFQMNQVKTGVFWGLKGGPVRSHPPPLPSAHRLICFPPNHVGYVDQKSIGNLLRYMRILQFISWQSLTLLNLDEILNQTWILK